MGKLDEAFGTMKHIKSLDALRGIAVLGVLAFHSSYLPFGWIGVQTFFVLSGFLITGILLKQKTVDLKSYLARFYWRRALRIWPLYFVCRDLRPYLLEDGRPSCF